LALWALLQQRHQQAQLLVLGLLLAVLPRLQQRQHPWPRLRHLPAAAAAAAGTPP
jgi:hypothetical protein